MAHKRSSMNIHYTQNHWVFVLCPSSGILNTRKQNVLETGSVCVFRRGEAYTYPVLKLALCKGPDTVDASLPLPEDETRSSFRNVVFPSYLEFRTIDKVQKASDPKCYTPSSEPFRFKSSHVYSFVYGLISYLSKSQSTG
jgi:hypothetical protein